MAGTFAFIGPYTCDQGIATVETVQQAPLGLIVQAFDTGSDNRGVGEFIYLQGVASTAIASMVTYHADDWSTVLTVADSVGAVALAMSASVASRYGWYQISGKGAATSGATVVENAALYLHASAGTASDDAVAGDFIYRMQAASAVSGAGAFDVELHRPNVNNLLLINS